jgi:DNA-binding CsgD family transcriptional regulator
VSDPRHKYVEAALAATDAEFAERLEKVKATRDERRRLVADYYARVETRLNTLASPSEQPPPVDPERAALQATVASLTPREREVLARLAAGDSEKQAARQLGLSPHTVHDHVKRIHRVFGVASRGELLARFVRF